MIYLVKSFREDKDTSGNNNPPLSEEGVEAGKKLKLRNNAIKFDMCYTSFKLKDFGSALILVGDKLIVQRTHSLDNNEKEEIISFVKSLPIDKSILIVFVKSLPIDKSILIVADDEVISVIKSSFDCIELK